jgi:predicted metal-dependent HD superfamily phosphohydrolase
MSILGREEARFDEYTRQIRREYIHVPEQMFFDKRPSFLETLIAGGIYLTPEFEAGFEERAKQNVAREIAALRSSNFL